MAIFIIFSSINVCAQLQSSSAGDDIHRLTSYSINFVNAFAVSLHPAAAVQLKRFEVGLQVERKFMLAELDQYSICGGVPIKLGALGIELHHIGYEEFHRQEVALAFARSLGKIDLGIQFNYEQSIARGYDPFNSVCSELSSTWHISEKLHSGFDARISFPNNKLPDQRSTSISYAFGLGYEISSFVLVGFSVSADDDQTASVSPGIQYRFADQFFVSISISSQPTEIYFAGGWKWNSLRIEASTSYHFQLGFTPGLLLLFQPEKK